MNLEAFIQIHVEYEKSRIDHNPAAKERARIWIETIEKAPRSVDGIQSLMDAKEVAMNKSNDAKEMRQLDREWSALLWLQSVIKRQLQSDSSRLLEV